MQVFSHKLLGDCPGFPEQYVQNSCMTEVTLRRKSVILTVDKGKFEPLWPLYCMSAKDSRFLVKTKCQTVHFTSKSQGSGEQSGPNGLPFFLPNSRLYATKFCITSAFQGVSQVCVE